MAEDKVSRGQQRLTEARRSPPREIRKRSRDIGEAVYDKDPLKHYVRKEGWLAPVREYVQRMHEIGVNRLIKYVTLPGYQAIDIGVMWKSGFIRRIDGIWTNVAICDRHYAGDVINNLGEFAAYSEQWLDAELSRPQSSLRKFFPVDVVNLDFWGSFLEEGETEYRILRNLEAVKQVVFLQSGQQFLLLLTHKISNLVYTPEARNEFRALLDTNLLDENFRVAYQAKYGGVDPTLCMGDLLQFSLLAVSKSVANLAKQHGYHLDEKFTAWYKRPGEPYQMGVQSILFVPIGNDDPKKNYEPKYPRRRLSHPAMQSLPPRIETEAGDSYRNFVSQLPDRHSIAVNAILDANQNLKVGLTQEAEQWQNWWRDLRDG